MLLLFFKNIIYSTTILRVKLLPFEIQVLFCFYSDVQTASILRIFDTYFNFIVNKATL